MSRIEFEQISENEIEVVIPPETPMDMVHQLTKSFLAKGLVEDLAKSTLSVRYFYRPEDNANQLADKLIKSLQGLSKDELPYWHPKAQMANQKRVREMQVEERRGKVPAVPNTAATPKPNANIIPHDDPTTAGGTGRRYAFVKDEGHADDCECEKCEMAKSGYGPKGGGQYSQQDNARRKMNNTGAQTGIGSNVNTKQYTSAKFTNMTPQTDPKLKRPQPVKTMKDMSPKVIEEIKARANAKSVKKAWADHLPFPNAEEEIIKLAKATRAESGEDAAANQLANLMSGKSMLGEYKLPNQVKAMFATPPPQPTDEQLFGHLVVTEEMEKAAQAKWEGNAFNNFLKEATKPIGERFTSQEEEDAYWANIKVADRDNGEPGY